MEKEPLNHPQITQAISTDFSERELGRRKSVQSVDPSIESFAALIRKIPVGLRYDGVMRCGDVNLHQFTELDESSPSYRASFYLDLEELFAAAVTKRRMEKRMEFARGKAEE